MEFPLKDNFDPELYNFDKNNDDSILGKGNGGCVYKAMLRGGKSVGVGQPKEVAVKEVAWEGDKAYMDTELLLLKNGKKLDHRNIVEYFYISKKPTTKMNIMLVYMELCDQSLFDYIKHKEVNLSVSDIKHVSLGVAQGLAYLHNQGIIHRDIKPGNILLKKTQISSSIQQMDIKVTDFNISKVTSKEDTSGTKTYGLGTQGFRAPEVLKELYSGEAKYNNSCDMWSLGILIYCMYKRKDLASVENIQKEIELIEDKGKELTENDSSSSLLHSFFFSSDPLQTFIDAKIKKMPEECQDILKSCLQTNYKKRETADNILNHVYLKGAEAAEQLAVDETMVMRSYENIKNDLRAGDQLWIYHKPSQTKPSYASVVVIINEEKFIHINAPNRMLAIKAKAIVEEEDRSRLCDELFCFGVRQDCPPDREQDIFSRRASICKGIRFDYNPDTSNCETFCNGVHGKWSTVQGARGKFQKTIKGYTKMKLSRAKDEKLTVQMQRKFKENGLILPEEII